MRLASALFIIVGALCLYGALTQVIGAESILSVLIGTLIGTAAGLTAVQQFAMWLEERD